MNQILNSEPSNNYNNLNNNEKIKTQTTSLDKILRVFAVCMIIFAVGLISSGVYSYKKNQDYSQDIASEEKSKANIKVEEKGKKILISVSHDKKINQLVYSWNGDRETKIQGTSNTIKKEIDLPAGNNNLIISVFDEDGEQTSFEQTFEAEDGVDIISPKIELSVTDDKKLKITATDENELDFITYRWNDDEEKRATPDDDDSKIELKLDIMKGSNDITIVAVDKSNNTSTLTKTYKGVNEPEIIIISNGDSLDITCKHENGIKKVEFTLNDRPYAAEFDDSPTDVQFTQDLDVGYNRIILTATSVDGTKKVFDGQTNYYPENAEEPASDDTTPNVEEPETTEGSEQEENN